MKCCNIKWANNKHWFNINQILHLVRISIFCIDKFGRYSILTQCCLLVVKLHLFLHLVRKLLFFHMYILGARNVMAPSPRRRRSLCELVRFDAVLCAKEAEDASKQYTSTYAIAMDFDAAISRKRPQVFSSLPVFVCGNHSKNGRISNRGIYLWRIRQGWWWT